MSSEDSFPSLMARLQAGDEQVATMVFCRFTGQLLVLVRSQISNLLRPKEDPEDILQSGFRSFFTRQREGQFQLENWESLWGVLTIITLRKCGHRIEYWGAGRRDVKRESRPSSAEIDQVVTLAGREPTPLEAASLTDLVHQLIRDQDDLGRQIVTLHLQGYTHVEIADQVGRAERTVRRTLAQTRKRLRRLQDEEAAVE